MNRRGELLVREVLDTNDLNIWRFESSAASLVWDTAHERLGMIMARTMLNGHQGAIAVVMNASTLEVIHNFGQTSGHSFANSLLLGHDGRFLGVDLGDNYPRGVNLHRFSASTHLPFLLRESKLVLVLCIPNGQCADTSLW